MAKGKVLIVDDDEDIRELVLHSLQSRGYQVMEASTGEQGVKTALAENPDLIILDIEMPGMDGIQACQEIRKRLLAPIIFLSVRTEESDIVLGLGVGADTYLTKPFSLPQLLAQVDAAIRRETDYSRRRSEAGQVRVKDLSIDADAHEVRLNGRSLALTPTEFKLLSTLARNAGRVLTRDELLSSVWDLKGEHIYSRTVDVHVGRIRKKIGDDPARQSYIVTVPGLGYKMNAG